MTRSIEREEVELPRLDAVWNAFCNKGVSHYPRFLDDKGAEQQIPNDEVIGRIASELGNLKDCQNAEVEFALERGRETLDEVKGLTEYEDQKATRNLTVITFLSALGSILFSRFSDIYPLRPLIDDLGILSLQGALIIVSYTLFFCFVLGVVSGALVVFHATRIRFKYPKLTTLTLAQNTERARSYLFYSPIIQVLPERWAQSFLEDVSVSADGKMVLNKRLGASYLKNYITESYLVATKVADKLRYLTPAQDILSWSIRVLLVWLFVIALTMAVVPNQSQRHAPDSAAASSPPLHGTGETAIDPAGAMPAQETEKPGG